jgi:hypothetical protein
MISSIQASGVASFSISGAVSHPPLIRAVSRTSNELFMYCNLKHNHIGLNALIPGLING